MLKFLRALFATLNRGWEWLVLHATGRDLAGEHAQRLEAERQAAVDEAERADQEARHAELLEATVAQTNETKRLREAMDRQSRVEAGREVSRRKEEIAAQSRSHDVEVRSSDWTDEPEPEDEVVVALRRVG